MRQLPLGRLAVTVLAVGLGGVVAGCQTDNGDGTRVRASASTAGANERGGRVVDRSQDQTVNPDGSAVRTRSQVRETPSGATIRETQTEKREVITPGAGGATSDPNGAR